MQNNKIIINNNTFELPEIVSNLFNEYLTDYYNVQKITDLEDSKLILQQMYDKTSKIKFIKRKAFTKQIDEIANEILKIQNNQINVEIPDWQTIEDFKVKYKFLYKLNDLTSNVMPEIIQDCDKTLIETYRKYVPQINTNIDFAKMNAKKENYNKAFKNLYKSLEINLIMYKLAKDLENNPDIDINNYVDNILNPKTTNEPSSISPEVNNKKSL